MHHRTYMYTYTLTTKPCETYWMQKSVTWGGYRFLCFYGHVMMFRYLLNFLAVSSASYYYISLSRVCIILYTFPLSFSFRIRRWCIKSRVFSSLNANWRMKQRWTKLYKQTVWCMIVVIDFHAYEIESDCCLFCKEMIWWDICIPGWHNRTFGFDPS